MTPSNRNKLFLVVGIIGFIAILFVLTLLSQKSDDPTNITDPNPVTGKVITTGITTRVVPTEDTKITINNKKVKEGSVELSPGTYTVTASHDGFKSESRTVTIKQNDRISVGLILISNSDDTKDYYDKHPDDISKAEGISGQKADADANIRIKTLPLLSSLPKSENHRYRITYGQSLAKPNDSTASIIYIEYVDEANKTAANNWIKYQGYDPATLETKYTLNKAL